jgi:Arc/MetJ-type ribon-helix-helix transcriptional regulator
MSDVFPADIQQRIEAQLASGFFATKEEVLREAMDALERRQSSLTQLRAMVTIADEDVAAGRLGAFSRENLKSSVRDRLAERGIRD